MAGGDVSRMRADASEVAAMGPDVIVLTNAALLNALRQANSSVPIVFVLVANVIESGMVASQARPGGNITGFTNFEPAIAGKWLEALKEIAPRVQRVGVIYSPETTLYTLSMPHIEAAGVALGVTPSAIPIRNGADIEREVAAFAREANGGLIVMPAPIVSVQRDRIFTQAARHQLPAIYPYRIYPEAGGLISYGIDVRNLFRQTASYVDRILRGANAWRSAGSGSDQIRAGDQPEDGKGTRPRGTAVAARPRRRGDRVRASRVHHAARRRGCGVATASGRPGLD